MPSQKLEVNKEAITESLVGLKHYNEKKRLDAMHTLIRNGQDAIDESLLSEVFASVGNCLCDEDAIVRTKASTFLFSLLSNRDPNTIRPFMLRLSCQMLAAMGNVKHHIRSDAVAFLRRCLPLRLFTSIEVRNMLRSLFEISGSMQSINTSKSVKNVEEQRLAVFSAVEDLLETLAEQRQSVEEGLIESTEWTLSAIFARVLWPPRDIDVELRRFLGALARQGDTETKDRMEKLALESGIICRNKIDTRIQPDERRKKATGRTSGTAFSRLSQLMKGDDSD